MSGDILNLDAVTVPYKLSGEVRTYTGNWTPEEINAGLAGEPTSVVYQEQWFDPSPDGPVEIHDPERIADLDARAAATYHAALEQSDAE